MNWRLTVVTPLHVLGLFHSMGVLFDGDTVAHKPMEQRVRYSARVHAQFFIQTPQT